MRKNVTINLYYNFGKSDENAFPDAPELGKNPHAQEAMKHMGITYKEAEPNSISDSWTFFDCENIPGKYPQWMTVWDGGFTRQEFYDKSMLRVKNTPEPNGQKYPVGSRVRIANNLGPYMSHFPGAGNLATVDHTYAHAYGGDNVKSYSLVIDGHGVVAWYDEDQLSAI